MEHPKGFNQHLEGLALSLGLASHHSRPAAMATPAHPQLCFTNSPALPRSTLSPHQSLQVSPPAGSLTLPVGGHSSHQLAFLPDSSEP